MRYHCNFFTEPGIGKGAPDPIAYEKMNLKYRKQILARELGEKILDDFPLEKKSADEISKHTEHYQDFFVFDHRAMDDILRKVITAQDFLNQGSQLAANAVLLDIKSLLLKGK